MNVEQLWECLAKLQPVSLGHMPTPLEPLPRLTEVLGGPEIWVKRDDQTGLATGGNKVRKLNFLMAEALRQQADPVMTTGAQQSNHARQTAAAAARLGLPCVLVLRGSQPQPATAPQGNYLLDTLLGAAVRWTKADSIMDALYAEAEVLRQAGRKPYIIPYGGSNELGVCGYVAGMAELWWQMEALSLDFDVIVIASSSGGTQAGLALGAQALGYQGHIVGISIAEPAEAFRTHIADLANQAAELLELDSHLVPGDINVDDAFLGEGYGVVGDLEREAILLAGRSEGLLVDPVYTGRALGGLCERIRQGQLVAGQRVLFWHTGGIPALFSYSEALQK
ncbi:MAG: D-cysteine desulfhydrase family protein [Anaerolineae bacterium]|nr:D-cysteine desulfhydrase family protein [Anaerolineae bacterium]